MSANPTVQSDVNIWLCKVISGQVDKPMIVVTAQGRRINSTFDDSPQSEGDTGPGSTGKAVIITVNATTP